MPVHLFQFTGFLHGPTTLPFSIYSVFTGSNQSPFFDLQGFYRVKPVPLFRLTVFLQGHTSLTFSGSNQFVLFSFIITSSSNLQYFHVICVIKKTVYSVYPLFTRRRYCKNMFFKSSLQKGNFLQHIFKCCGKL